MSDGERDEVHVEQHGDGDVVVEEQAEGQDQESQDESSGDE
jgi:hypothetical protein